MIIYGVKILSDTPFQTHLFEEGEIRYRLKLSAMSPHEILHFNTQLTCGTFLHTTHEHKISLFSNQDMKETLTPHTPLCYEVANVVRFYWYHGSFEIFYEKAPHTTQKTFEFWFIHTFFSFFLSIEKRFVLLHGSAIEIEQKAILFLAPYKSGKSTLTHYMTQHHHHTLITDDILPTFIKEKQVIAVPSHPHSRPDRGLCELGYFIPHSSHTFHPLSAIYILENTDHTQTTITEIKGIQKFILAKKNSVIYTLPSIRLEHERYLGTLLNTLPVFHIKRSWGKEYLEETYQVIREHVGCYL